MNVLGKSWADCNSKSEFILTQNKSFLNPDDNSVSFHIPQSHNYELENSHSGLNILFKLTNLECDNKKPQNDFRLQEDQNDIESKNVHTNTEIFKKQDSYPDPNKNFEKNNIKLKNLDLTHEELMELSSTKTHLKRGLEIHTDSTFTHEEAKENIPLQLSELLDSPKNKSKQELKKRKKNRKINLNQSIDKIESAGASIKSKEKSKKNNKYTNVIINHSSINPFQSETMQVPLYCHSTVGFMPILIPNSLSNQFPNKSSIYPFINKANNIQKSSQNTGISCVEENKKLNSSSTKNSNLETSQNTSDTTVSNQKRRLESRLKEIAVGKSTVGYRNYIKTVPKQLRTDLDPDTPNPFNNSTASDFRAKCQTWRRTLHNYDAI